MDATSTNLSNKPVEMMADTTKIRTPLIQRQINMDSCYSCVLESLLRLALFHPFPQRPSKTCQAVLAWSQQVVISPHLSRFTWLALCLLVKICCAHAWLYLVPALWPMFTHSHQTWTDKLTTFWNAWLHIQIRSCVSLWAMLSPWRLALLDCLQNIKKIEYCSCDLHQALWPISYGFGFSADFSFNSPTYVERKSCSQNLCEVHKPSLNPSSHISVFIVLTQFSCFFLWSHRSAVV